MSDLLNMDWYADASATADEANAPEDDEPVEADDDDADDDAPAEADDDSLSEDAEPRDEADPAAIGPDDVDDDDYPEEPLGYVTVKLKEKTKDVKLTDETTFKDLTAAAKSLNDSFLSSILSFAQTYTFKKDDETLDVTSKKLVNTDIEDGDEIEAFENNIYIWGASGALVSACCCICILIILVIVFVMMNNQQ